MEQGIFLPEEGKKHQYPECSNYATNKSGDFGQKGYVNLGTLTLTMPAIQLARLHFRPLQRFLLKVWNHRMETTDTRVKIPTSIKPTLWWWRNRSILSKGLLWSFLIQKIVTTDVSMCRRGGGAHLDQDLAWSMVPDRSSEILKLEGAKSGCLLFKLLRIPCPDSMVQRHYRSLPDQAGRHEKQNSSTAVSRNSGIGGKPFSVPFEMDCREGQ